MLRRRRRSGMTMGLLSLGLLAGATLTAGPAQAVDAVGPYYAAPAWDQKLPAATRFIVLTDWNSAAVLDKETGLVWERMPSTASSEWTAARKACTAHTTGGRKGWRLPSVHELASLIDPSVPHPQPALPPGHPFMLFQPDADVNSFWAATTWADAPTLPNNRNLARAVHFQEDGRVAGGFKQGVLFRSWCVRGGIHEDAY